MNDWRDDEPLYSDRPLYSPTCPICGSQYEWHYDSYNDVYLCQRWES